MSRSNLYRNNNPGLNEKFMLIYAAVAFIVILIGLYFYSQSIIRIEKPEKDLGKKVVITLPEGKTIYTYENLLLKEDGKLLYKGERNTIDLTGGEVNYKNWK